MPVSVILIQLVPELIKKRFGGLSPSVTALSKKTGLSRPTVKAWITNPDLTSYDQRALIAWALFFNVRVIDLIREVRSNDPL